MTLTSFEQELLNEADRLVAIDQQILEIVTRFLSNYSSFMKRYLLGRGQTAIAVSLRDNPLLNGVAYKGDETSTGIECEIYPPDKVIETTIAGTQTQNNRLIVLTQHDERQYYVLELIARRLQRVYSQNYRTLIIPRARSPGKEDLPARAELYGVFQEDARYVKQLS